MDGIFTLERQTDGLANHIPRFAWKSVGINVEEKMKPVAKQDEGRTTDEENADARHSTNRLSAHLFVWLSGIKGLLGKKV